MPFAGDRYPVEALAPGAGNLPLRDAFARGAFTGVLMIRTPAAVNLASWSRIKNLKQSA
jgi:hypothetical protein